MNEIVDFLKTDWNVLWGMAALVSGGLWVYGLVPTQARRQTLSAQMAVQMMNREDAVMLDVREKNEFVQGHIPGSRNAPIAHLENTLKQLGLAKDAPVILSCETGTRASQAFKTLIGMGFNKTFLLESGLSGWRNAGMPVVKKG